MDRESSHSPLLPRMFFRSNGAILLFARFVDRAYLQSLVEDCKELVSLVLSSQESVLYSAEVELAASALLYLPSIILHGGTVGQMLCGLNPASVVTVGKTEKVDGSSKSYHQKALLALLYVFLPYLYNRKVEIYTGVSDFVQFLRQEESNSDAETVDNSDFEPREDTNHDSLESVEVLRFTSLSTIVWRAMQLSFYKISREMNVRMERILQFINDIHLFFFALNEKYLEWPLRLIRMQLFTQVVAPGSLQQIKLKSLSWLFGFRITLLIYYAARVMMHEIDDQLFTLSNPTSSESELGDHSGASITEVPSATVVNLWGTCPLCLDTIRQAASLPCGHICCWECVTSYAFSAQVQQNELGQQCKCPVCRYEFPRQRIRAIHT